jgi:hypothetical protein
MLYNFLPMARRVPLTTFRKMIREIVHDAEHGEPTVLTHYKRDIAAVVPMNMVNPPIPPAEKNPPATHGRTHRKRQQVS